MIRWLREVMDPGRLAEVLLVAWLPTTIIALAHVLTNDGWPKVEELRFGQAALFVVLFIWGIYRVFQAHPLMRPGYGRWLATTPWAVPQPLPDGPVHLVKQDLVILAPFVLPAAFLFGEEIGISLLMAFVTSYLAALGFCIMVTGPRRFAYLTIAGVGALVLLQDPIQIALTAFGVYVVARVGLLRSLEMFPWDVSMSQSENRAKQEAAQMGWPFSRLGPAPPPAPFPRWESIAISLLFGWWVFVIAERARMWGMKNNDPNMASGLVLMLIGYGSMFCIIARISRYQQGFAAPITLWARIRTGRLFLRKYDVVYFAPLMALLVVATVPTTLTFWWKWPIPVAGGISGAMMIFCVVGVGPSRASWMLTSRARLVPSQQEKMAAGAFERNQNG